MLLMMEDAAFGGAVLDQLGGSKRRPRFCPEFLQNQRKRAKARKSGLKEVEANKGGEQQPPRSEEMRKPEAGKDHGAREGHDDSVYSHALRPFDFAMASEHAAFAFPLCPEFFRFCVGEHSAAQNSS